MTARERAEHLIENWPDWPDNSITAIEMVITTAVEAEREECAKIVDSEARQIEEWGAPSAEELTRVLAYRIRARSKGGEK